MKKLLTIFIFLSLYTVPLRADMGNCVVYYAKFYLKNDTSFEACFEISGYEEGAYLNDRGYNPYCNHKGLFDLLKMRQKALNEIYGVRETDGRGYASIPVYKRLEYVSPRGIEHKPYDILPVLGFVASTDIVYLQPADIAKIAFLRAENSKREWVTTSIITGSTGKLDSIRRKHYRGTLYAEQMLEIGSFVVGFEITEDVPVGYCFYNYNPDINITELKRLILLKFPGEFDAYEARFIKENHLETVQSWPPALRWQYEEGIQKIMDDVVQWFWNKGIVMLRENGTC